jgi:hypothetical protein
MKGPEGREDRLDFVLHVGLSKTGTTMLQQHFFPDIPEVYYLGKNRELKTPRQCIDDNGFEILNPLLWDHREEWDASQVVEAVKKQARSNDPQKRIWLASWEELANRRLDLHLESLRRIQNVFGHCRMLVVLRNPLERISSEYLQELRYNYLKVRYPPNGRYSLRHPVFPSLDRWLNDQQKTGYLQILLATGDLVRKSMEIIGKENLGVFLYEQLRADSPRFLRSLATFLGVESTEELVNRPVYPKYRHARITEGQVRFLRGIENSFWRKIAWLHQSSRVRRKKFLPHAKDGVPEKALLPEAWREVVIDQTDQGHCWLEETFGLPLSVHGYPMSANPGDIN